ncbi:MAG: GGDEF domain-containing protein [Polyangiaceae bacterium]|nr:GGDEF domain-containing protein [Polyangiaceae bacterium]
MKPEKRASAAPGASHRSQERLAQGHTGTVTEPQMAVVRLPDEHDRFAFAAEDPSFSEVQELDTQIESNEVDALAMRPVRRAQIRAVLMRMDGITAGQVQSIDADDVVLGRHACNGIAIDDAGISRQHARIRRVGATHEVLDLGSANGTFVMGKKIVRAVLQDGDWLQFGPRICFRYSQIDARHEQVLRELYEASTKDALTGAFNRKHFDERLVAEIAFARRHKAPISLLLADVDHFKRVNDTWGHPAGDAVLRQVARAIAQRLRTEDVFARFGGEEFVVILRGIDEAGAVRVGERIRATIGAVPCLAAGATIPVTVSVGCATLGAAPETSASALLEIADRRLYQAKALGRNRVVWQD